MNRPRPQPASQRQLRVGESIRHALSEILARCDLRDPAVNGRSITVTEVQCSADLRSAIVFVVPLSITGSSSLRDLEEVVAGLQRSAAFLRGQINQAVVLKYSPRITFSLDTTFDEARRIQDVLDNPLVARDLVDKLKDESST